MFILVTNIHKKKALLGFSQNLFELYNFSQPRPKKVSKGHEPTEYLSRLQRRLIGYIDFEL